MKVLLSFKMLLLVSIWVSAISLITATGSAYALCATQPEDDEWVYFSGNSSLAAINIDIGCSDQVHCTGGECNYVGGGISIHAYGDCTPTDCDWGEAHETHEIGDWIFGIWDFGWKMTWVWVKMSPVYEDQIYVKVFHDYNDGRKDRWDYGYFIRRDQSCIDSCNGKAPGGCWCDAYCTSYGDCCVDKARQCGP